ncbi:MAG TPA: acyl-CoA thioesterase domain-containing protein, partial [Acidimicrobiia bacterium]|nr:acyl-CoA thioesterase domain-containing protein [Acidimicrobiia bacterium]
MSALDDLVGLLDLEALEVNLFRGESLDSDRARLYGGEVLAQALMAAGRTLEDERRVHSMHAYFLKLGDPKVPVVYEVDRIRDGRSFTTRRVVAIQHGTAIFNMAASFQVDEAGPDHHDEMPPVATAETLGAMGDHFQGDEPEPIDRQGAPHVVDAFDMRHVG